MTVQFLDARAAGSREDPLRLFADFDSQNGLLTISDVMPYRPSANPLKGKTPQEVAEIKQLMKQTIILTDIGEAFSKWDMCFNVKEHLDEAVKAFYSFQAMKALVLENEVQSQYNPEHVVQVRAMDMSGQVYELNSEEVTNGHIAVLMICWGAQKMRGQLSLIQEDHEPTQDDEDACNYPFCL
ncbi:hypothetical protein [Acinetobacter sp. ANC 3813]|uniref:hypothetical protein n=1 Tax=Acinetobacter sp. ANC 3813 TaxID=1977873 RepID=UPI000A342B8B|nr:hypothetical protein [Acinetobacter sp. ANC 3813]OTG87898.1 hypothetical protein B9T34_16320 [Acinetobacter sp. ANC 3813]